MKPELKKVQISLNDNREITIERGIRKTINWYIDNETWWREILEKKYAQNRLGESV
jgi:dTDP-glucose 4,6-dehydratase